MKNLENIQYSFNSDYKNKNIQNILYKIYWIKLGYYIGLEVILKNNTINRYVIFQDFIIDGFTAISLFSYDNITVNNKIVTKKDDIYFYFENIEKANDFVNNEIIKNIKKYTKYNNCKP